MPTSNIERLSASLTRAVHCTVYAGAYVGLYACGGGVVEWVGENGSFAVLGGGGGTKGGIVPEGQMGGLLGGGRPAGSRPWYDTV